MITQEAKKFWAVVEVEPFEAPVYWNYWDSLEKAEVAKKLAEEESEWFEGLSFHFVIKEIYVS